MIHEPTAERKSAGIDRRPLPPSMIVRKSGGPETSVASALRQRGGNRGMQRLLGEMSSNSKGVTPPPSPSIQAKLTISQPGDAHEREADRVADAVMRMPAPTTSNPPVNQLRAEYEDELAQKTSPGGAPIQKKEQTAPAPPVTPAVAANIQATRGGGSQLPAETRAFFEPRFGVDFSQVRVHTDSHAARAAESIDAKAFTVGRGIAFAAGQFSPASQTGRQLLAHELTHVVQQNPSSGRQGNIHVSPVAAGYVQRFESHEHVQLGDTAGGPGAGLILLECHDRDLPQHASPVITWPPAWQTYYTTLTPHQQRALTRGLTYGEIVALSGDMYTDFQALNRAPLREVIDLIPLIRSASATTQQLQAATGGRYLALAKENIGHFSNVPTGQRNRDIWRRNHIDAIAAARTGNANLAWGLNAAGDHFLTDAFSGGHLRVQRSLLHAQGTTGDVTSKVLHDLDNKFGVQVTNDRGDPPWIAYGDEHLNDAANTRSRTLALEAVQLSKQDIADALARGAGYPAPTAATVFAAERLIPRPVSMAANRWTLGDMARELQDLAKHEAPGVASELVGDDDRVRDWINRMDPAALSRQSETDVARMLNVLLSGVVTDDDMRAIERLLGSVTDATVMSRLRAVFRPRAINIKGFGLRIRFRIALDRSP